MRSRIEDGTTRGGRKLRCDYRTMRTRRVALRALPAGSAARTAMRTVARRPRRSSDRRIERRVALESFRRSVVRAPAASVAFAVRVLRARAAAACALRVMSTRPLARTAHSSSQRTRMVTNAGAQRVLARGGAQQREGGRAAVGRRRGGAGRQPADERRRPGARAAAREAVDGAAERRGVDATAAVLAEARHVGHGQPQRARRARRQRGARDDARAVVAVQVGARELGQGGVAHDVAAGDRARGAVRVLDDRQDGSRRGAGRSVARIGVQALVLVPAVVGARAVARGGGEVDLLVAVLADVADDEVAGVAVVGEAPRVAQAVGEDRDGAGGRVDLAGACRGGSRG